MSRSAIVRPQCSRKHFRHAAQRTAPNVAAANTEYLEDAANTDWLMRHADQPFSMVDAVSFAIMAERGTRAALTLDRHFAVAGYEMVTG